MSEPEDKIYLEERKLVRRYSPLTSVLVNTLFLFVVFYLFLVIGLFFHKILWKWQGFLQWLPLY